MTAHHLRDLYGHQAWADAEHWRVIEENRPAGADRAIRDRLHHIHLVQHAFLWAVRDGKSSFTISRPDDFASSADLKAFACRYHDEIATYVADATDDMLTAMITIPWFKEPPLTITIAEALTQCAMHSHYHRGQNATRIRELGGEPPATDFIVWLWKGRPSPAW